MNSRTKILVIPLKTLIICLALVALAVITLIIFLFVGKNKDTSNNLPRASATSANADTDSWVTYSPGVYTASFTLNGTPVDIQVTVDENNINSIEMVNLSESVTTMYPMLDKSFAEIRDAVIENNSTANILYESDNKYTSTIFLEAIQAALDKCTIR